MYVKHTTTTFWIFCLTFVSIHHNHNQFEFTNAAAIEKADAAKHQKWLRQWLPRVQQTHEVAGDVEISEAEIGVKHQSSAVEGDVAKQFNLYHEENAVKPKKHLKYVDTMIPKINDTGGGELKSLLPIEEDDQEHGVADLMKLIKFKKPSETHKINTKEFKHNSPTANGDSLVYDFKESLQKLLQQSPSRGDDTGNRGRSSINKSQHDNVYAATSTSSTIKRAATQLTTPQAQRSTSMAFPLRASTYTKANVTATNSAQQLPFVERRHIVPEKLQYTKEITIKQGLLMGIRRNFHTSTGLRDVDQYLGIPYAEAPIGSRRFMPPGTPLPWQGLKMAHHLPPVCPQKLPDISMKGSEKMSKSRYRHLTRLLPYLKTENEDCLYLNVYVPNTNDAEVAGTSTGTFTAATSVDYDDDANARTNAKADKVEQRPLYPVIVYIHGESFEWNSGNAYDGSVLASYGEVIVVTVNYRIGILGFMRPSINENTVANFGLLDQIAALHWIKENIHSFGGDKDSVTLMGHSTGAACVNYLMVSPVASGLFHRAILMSGSAMSDWAATNHSMQLTMKIAHGLNCPLNDDNEEMLSCLRQKRYQDILKIPTSLSQFSTSLGPIVDGHVIPNQPYKVMGQYTEHFSRYDLLFGITESESYHSLGAQALEEGLRENERDNLLRFYMQSRFDVRPDLALAATLKKYSDMYTNPIKATNMEHRDVVLDILSDARVVGPLMQTGLFHAEVDRRNFMYVFGHNSFGGPHASLPHSIAGEELAFVFGAPLSSAGLFHGIHYTPQEKLLAEAVMSYWCNFVKTGNPKAPWKNAFINLHTLEWDRYDLEWPEFNKRSQAYMNIGIPPSVGYKYRQVYMNFWNKELPDELNQIAHIQQQPFLEASYANTHNMQSMPGTTAIYPKRYGLGSGAGVGLGGVGTGAGAGSEVITGHMNKFGARDNGVEDPVRTLKLLMQEPYNKPAETAENMYNAPPSTTYVGKVRHRLNSAEDADVDVRNYEVNYNGFGYGVRSPTTSSSIYGIRHYDTMTGTSGAGGNSGGQVDNYDQSQYANPYHTNNGNYVNEDNKAVDGLADTESQEHVAKSETTLQLLIGLIIIFIILNVIIYSTILMQKKKKTQTIQRKLGTGILTYEGATDDDLKRSKPNTNQDDGDSYIMDAMRKSNTYEAVKTERGSLNGFKITRQLSCSTVDTHTKVSEWMSTGGHNKGAIQRRPSSNQNSKKSSSFSSVGGSGSFGKHPLKVSVAIDATPDTRGSSVSEQEPIEITKLKQDGRNIIICQDVEVEDQELLSPQDSLDTSRYTLMRQHSTVTEACEGELIQPLHYHSRSDPVDMYYRLEAGQDEKVTSFIHSDTYDDVNVCVDVNVTSRDDSDKWPAEALTQEQQLDVIKRRRYPKVLPTFMQYERETDSPPMTKDLSMTYKRNSLPPNSFSFHAQHGKQQPPLPPPRTVATLGRKPSPGRRNSSNVTTSPVMLAHDCTEEEEEPKITQNTLIVGSLKATEGYYSTLKRKNKPPVIETNADKQHQQLHRQSSVFQSFESSPIYETPEREMPAHLTEKIYSIQPALTAATHHPSCYASEPTTPVAPSNSINGNGAYSSPNTPVYAQPKKSHIPRVISSNTSSLIHSTITPAVMSSSSSATLPEAASGLATTAGGTAAASTSTCNTGRDTTNCCHVTPMVLDDNQVPSKETLQQTSDTPTIITTTTEAMNNSKEHQQLLTMGQSRIPQLHRNANAANYESQHQPHLINKDKTNAYLIPRAPNILTSIPKQTTEAAALGLTSSNEDVTLVTKPSKAPAEADDDAGCDDHNGDYDDDKVDVVVTAGVGVLKNPLSNKKTASVASSCSSKSSTCSSMRSDSAASSSSATSSSTGTVRTELQQHK